MPRRCASAALRIGDRLAGEEDLAAVGLVDAGHDLDQRRFAGAVLAEQRVDLARIERERHVLERLGRVEALGDVAHLENRRRRPRRIVGWPGRAGVRLLATVPAASCHRGVRLPFDRHLSAGRPSRGSASTPTILKRYRAASPLPSASRMIRRGSRRLHRARCPIIKHTRGFSRCLTPERRTRASACSGAVPAFIVGNDAKERGDGTITPSPRPRPGWIPEESWNISTSSSSARDRAAA